MEFAFFYLFSTLAIISAVMVIWSPSKGNPVHSVLFLVLVFCNATGLLILLEVEFLALLFLVVYVGAIAVLFLFVVMMLAPAEGKMATGNTFGELSSYGGGFLLVALLLASIFLGEVFFVVRGNLVSLEESIEGSIPSYIGWIQVLDGTGSSTSNLESLGQVLYTYYFYYFLVAGFVLLVAMIGAIVLTLEKGAQDSVQGSLQGSKGSFQRVPGKGQQIYEQLSRDVQKAVFFVE
jgi:NADH-quinone oxidoreductase subunit J